MEKKRVFPVLCLIIIFQISLSESAFSWAGRTHRKITSDAYFIMPQAFRQFLGETPGTNPKNPNLKALLAASIEPDTVLKDFRNHVYHIHGYDMGNGPFHVENLLKEIAGNIRSHSPKAAIIQKIGWLSHYVADLTQPLHSGVATWEGIEEKTFHSSFENDVNSNLYTFGVMFDGAVVVQRISARMVYESLWANQYYCAIETAYTKGKKYLELKDISAKCYSRAVNNVVDIWYTLWEMSGGKINPDVESKPLYYPPFWRIFPTSGEWSAKVNINKAPLELLTRLPGIGPSVAEEVIKGRPYKTIEDLIRVKGISVTFFESIKNKIKV